MSQKKYILIIPAFNEEDNIGAVIKKIRQDYPDMPVLAIDDGSTDNTASIASESGARVISLPFNLGYGAALQTGFKYALCHGYDYLAYMDADGQHETGSLSFLLSEIATGGYDIVIGSRFLGRNGYSSPALRKLGIHLFRLVTRIATGERITDPTSGFRALNRRACEFYSAVYPSDFPDADVIITSCFAGLKIKEVPVKMYSKDSGKSMHSGLKPFYYIFKMSLSLLAVFIRKLYGKIDNAG